MQSTLSNWRRYCSYKGFVSRQPLTPPPADVPSAVAPLPYVPPPTHTGIRRPDSYQPSPYEQKMDEQELEYRRRRSAQEQAQERRYQQWEQERARERNPRYEWMR